jgi:hypothetical protein
VSCQKWSESVRWLVLFRTVASLLLTPLCNKPLLVLLLLLLLLLWKQAGLPALHCSLHCRLYQ